MSLSTTSRIRKNLPKRLTEDTKCFLIIKNLWDMYRLRTQYDTFPHSRKHEQEDICCRKWIRRIRKIPLLIRRLQWSQKMKRKGSIKTKKASDGLWLHFSSWEISPVAALSLCLEPWYKWVGSFLNAFCFLFGQGVFMSRWICSEGMRLALPSLHYSPFRLSP